MDYHHCFYFFLLESTRTVLHQTIILILILNNIYVWEGMSIRLRQRVLFYILILATPLLLLSMQRLFKNYLYVYITTKNNYQIYLCLTRRKFSYKKDCFVFKKWVMPLRLKHLWSMCGSTPTTLLHRSINAVCSSRLQRTGMRRTSGLN